jgi:dTDP-4-amino-4,6-dideoxy-D-galactose acyltransferase
VTITITPLPFDSSLFGYPVGKCQLDEFWDEADFLNEAKEFRLVYIFSRKPVPIHSGCIHLADIRLTFGKELRHFESTDILISPYSGELTKVLLDLALESGVYSRFHTDPAFDQEEYKKLYTLWIKNALENQEVLLAERMAGFVSCQLSEEKAQIGLIAVAQNRRGQGWGKKLVRAAEALAFENGARYMTIGTQQVNVPATSLYQSVGYKEIDRVWVYHWWDGR